MKYGLLVCALLMAIPGCCMRKKDKKMKTQKTEANMKKTQPNMKNSKY